MRVGWGRAVVFVTEALERSLGTQRTPGGPGGSEGEPKVAGGKHRRSGLGEAVAASQAEESDVTRDPVTSNNPDGTAPENVLDAPGVFAGQRARLGGRWEPWPGACLGQGSSAPCVSPRKSGPDPVSSKRTQWVVGIPLTAEGAPAPPAALCPSCRSRL